MTGFDAQAARERAEAYAAHSLTHAERNLAHDVLALDAQVTALREVLAQADAVRSDVKILRERMSSFDSEALDAIARIAGFVGRARLAAVPAPEEGAER